MGVILSFHTWGNRRGIFPPEAHARQIWLCRSTPGRTVVEQYVALYVSLQKIAVCVLAASGRVVIEAEVDPSLKQRFEDVRVETLALHQPVHCVAFVIAKFKVSVGSYGNVTTGRDLDIATGQNCAEGVFCNNGFIGRNRGHGYIFPKSSEAYHKLHSGALGACTRILIRLLWNAYCRDARVCFELPAPPILLADRCNAQLGRSGEI
jgi:hypothetical protein